MLTHPREAYQKSIHDLPQPNYGLPKLIYGLPKLTYGLPK